jgi:hypothetical protein
MRRVKWAFLVVTEDGRQHTEGGFSSKEEANKRGRVKAREYGETDFIVYPQRK